MNHIATKILAALAALLLACTANAQLTGRPLPQDTSHAMNGYAILGVRLGMPEADAIAAIKRKFPDQQTENGSTYKNAIRDFAIPSPVTHQPVRAGFRLEEYAGTRFAQDAVRVLTVDGHVWAIWYHDGRGRYDYDKALADIVARYPGAGQIPSLFDVVDNGRRQGDGSKGSSGVELYDGKCPEGQPLFPGGNGVIQLEAGCHRVLWVNYSILKTSGVKTMAGGTAQLVDVDGGRHFLETTKGEAAARAREDNKRGGDVKL